MLDGIIKNADNSYELLKVVNGKLSVIHVSKDGFTKSNHEYVDSLLSQLYLNNNCVFVEKLHGYNIYFDKETNFKHFVKGSTEDMQLFWKVNGQDAVCYLSKEKRDKILALFLVGAAVMCLSINILRSYNNTPFTINIDKSIHELYSSVDIDKMYDLGVVDYDKAVELINNSNLGDDDKRLLLNEDLLRDVFKYYRNTPMEYLANLKFNNIEIEYYEDPEYDADGYYIATKPNVLHVSKVLSCTENHVKAHEYAHLLQAEGVPYIYLKEAVAELTVAEYYDGEIVSYVEAVDNLKLLIDIIGPEPVLKLIYGGDDKDFKDSLQAYISEDECNQLLAYLCKEPNKENHDHDDIKNILCDLYSAKAGESIEENDYMLVKYYDKIYENGFDPFNSSYIRATCKYLNPHEMEEVEYADLSPYDEDKIFTTLNDGERIQEYKTYYYRYYTYNEYKKLKDKEHFEFDYNLSDGLIHGFRNENNEFYLLDKPVSYDNYLDEGDIDLTNLENLPGRTMSFEKAIKLQYLFPKLKKEESEITDMKDWFYECSYPTVFYRHPNIEKQDGKYVYFLESIRHRFPEQFSRMGDICNAPTAVETAKVLKYN